MVVAKASQFDRKPLLIKSINALMSTGLYRADFTFDKMVRQARRKALQPDLSDFWEEPLKKLLESIIKEADLSAVGSFMINRRLTDLLIGRMNAEYWFQREPGIDDQVINPPWVIAGLQRTGTTKLQRLFTLDQDNRSLLGWEALNPAPVDEDWKSRDKRPAIGKLSQNALKTISPTFFAIHPVEYRSPEEDILLLDFSFMSTTFEATMRVPSYAGWLESVSNKPAYEYELRLLKLLQWQNPGKRWILKSPHHLEHIDIIHQLHPQVKIICTHRNIHECIPSFISMMAHSWSMFSNNVTMEEVRDHWVKKIRYMVDQALNYRKQKPSIFTDILYSDLVNDSKRVLSKLMYQDWSEEFSQKLTQVEVSNPKAKYGVHEYSHLAVGLSENRLDETFSEYIRFFNSLESIDG